VTWADTVKSDCNIIDHSELLKVFLQKDENQSP